MIAIIFCVAAFVFSYVAGRRSLVAGLATVFTVGYFYGIVRANVPETFSHFVFDAAVFGLYVVQLFKGSSREEQRRQQALKIWVGVLMVWPFLLFFVPVQDYVVQVVGLRGNIFLLPFVLLGARLRDVDVQKLALAIAVLNIIAFAVACAEYTGGVERFFPQNQVTELIYQSTVDEDFTNPNRSEALRIPSTFTSAHAYAGMMVLTFTVIFGAWFEKRDRARWQRYLLYAAIAASILGVFMAAARSPVIILALVMGTILLFGRLKSQGWLLFLVMLVGIGWLVSSEDRMQRFTTLKDVDFVSERVSWSVNDSFFDLVVSYPMGNGLGGGGTSMPYFLLGRVRPPEQFMENEYARIVLEQGVIGLCLWAGFIWWAFTRRTTRTGETWFLGRRLLWVVCAAFFATGMIGTGLMTSIPGTAMMLLIVGWIVVPRAETQRAEEMLAPQEREGLVELRPSREQYV